MFKRTEMIENRWCRMEKYRKRLVKKIKRDDRLKQIKDSKIHVQ